MMNRRTWLFLSSAVALTASIACILNPQPLPPDTNDAAGGGAGGHQNPNGNAGTGGSGGSSGGGGGAGASPGEAGLDATSASADVANPKSLDGATDVKARDGGGSDAPDASSD